jgi:hypothetical protein
VQRIVVQYTGRIDHVYQDPHAIIKYLHYGALSDSRLINIPPNMRDLLLLLLADDKGFHKGATYVPFIVEQLFPILMMSAGKNLKSYQIALPE